VGGQIGFIVFGSDGRGNDGGGMAVADVVLYNKYRPDATLFTAYHGTEIGVKYLAAFYIHSAALLCGKSAEKFLQQ
jgi:hypothetical protein